MQDIVLYGYGNSNTHFKTPVPSAQSSEGARVFAFAGVEY
jgi:hypothetical protein